MEIKLISVTPELATQYLAKTQKNRNKKPATIRRYANDMMRGKWLDNTAETIKFNTVGSLIDGQHRLEAVVMSKKTISFWVAFDVPDAAMQVIDTGAIRSAGDALKIAGHNGYSNEIAALARKCIAIEGGNEMVLGSKKIKLGAAAVTNADILAYCEQHDLTDHCRFGQKISQQQFIRTLTTSEYQFLHWFLGRIDRTAAETFLGNLANLDGLRDGDPIYTLTRRLNQGKDSLTGKMRLHAIVTAWNAWRRGEKLSVIRVAHLESEPAIPQAI